MTEGLDLNLDMSTPEDTAIKQSHGRTGRTEPGIYLLTTEVEPTAEAQIGYTYVRAIGGQLVKVFMGRDEDVARLNWSLHSGALRQ
jgi:hypothetical protein